ncbi:MULTISPECIES: CPBP family intramembrane glutamic endopeptidase [unclassified Romboutsia]|uniref:CPBP family intramembrane glutamic endopeptidase n=1 Tax=unclassified Romboutsia TaxID=2626894 RepID=UPI0008229D3F|nr:MULTISPECIES: type II CAAX endopeptidase family protein [unclassified Romboutsia]SCI27133.1 CAAX amino terminal protease self-immunity [uncultured Clostridium sp.]
MNKKKAAILTISGYLIVMIIGVFASNLILNLIGGVRVDGMHINESNIISKLIIQIPPTIFILYFINKYYGWKNVGFSKINEGGLIWCIPYVVVILCMLSKFISEILKNIQSFTTMTCITIICTFIGAFLAGFSEEVIFRGVFLNSFKTRRSAIGAMILSSLGFSIMHLTTIVMGIPLLDVITRVINSSLLGFAFVGLVIKVNNIWPIIIYHVIWNYIIMVSSAIGLEISSITSICNILNLIMAIILWIIIIKDELHRNKFVYHIDNLLD